MASADRINRASEFGLGDRSWTTGPLVSCAERIDLAESADFADVGPSDPSVTSYLIRY